MFPKKKKNQNKNTCLQCERVVLKKTTTTIILLYELINSHKHSCEQNDDIAFINNIRISKVFQDVTVV